MENDGNFNLQSESNYMGSTKLQFH